MENLENPNGIKAYYSAVAEEFADEWYANESLMPVLKQFISLSGDNPCILDLGCGAGYESMRLHRLGARVVGVDYCEEAIAIARRKNPDCRFEVMDFRELDASLGKFDGIAAIASIIHICDNELELVFKNMQNVIKENGFLMAAFIEGSGISTERSLVEHNGIKYDRTFFLHPQSRMNEAARNAGFDFIKQITLPDEISGYGWVCSLYRQI